MIALYATLFGLALGSFANVAIDRVPRRLPLGGRSRCDGCRRALGALEMIPALSYIWLRGRCATCDAPIGLRSPIVEALCGAAFGVAFALFAPAAALIACSAGLSLVVMTGVALKRAEVNA